MAVAIAAQAGYASELRDRLWMWGHHPDAIDKAASMGEKYNLPTGNRIDMADACAYMGIANCCVVRWRGLPEIPCDDYARQFTNLKRVAWSVVDSGKEPFDVKKAMALKFADEYDNVAAIYLDDYFSGNEMKKCPPEQLAALKAEFARTRSKPKLTCVLYSDANELRPEYKRALDLCDQISFWCWGADNLPELETKVKNLRRMIGPAKPILLGVYMWDFGGAKPLTCAQMEAQLNVVLKLLRSGEITGLIFHCTPLCDLKLEAVEFAREWIRNYGDEKLAD